MVGGIIVDTLFLDPSGVASRQAFMLQESSPRVDKGEVQRLLVHAGGSVSLPCLAGYNGRIAG